MKKINPVIFILFLLFQSTTYAQVSEQLKKAAQLTNEGKNQEAFDLLTTILKEDPNNAGAYAWLGLYYTNTQNIPLAITNFLKAWTISNSPNYSQLGQSGWTQFSIVTWIAYCYGIQKDYKNQVYYAKLSGKWDTDKKESYGYIESAYRQSGMYDSAIYYAKEQLKIETRDWRPYYQLGVCNIERKSVELARYYYQKAIEVGSNPSNEAIGGKLPAYPFMKLGEIFISESNPTAAVDYYNQAIVKFNELGIKPGDGESYAFALTSRAICKETLIDYEGALADIKMASQYDPTNESIAVANIRVSKKLQAQQKLLADAQTKLGCFEGDCATGSGAYRFKTGDVYRGQFLGGVKQGAGVLAFATGDTYSGTFISDQFGDGTYTKSDGSITKFAGGQQVIKQEFRNINYEDQQSVKKARKGGFWRALGDIAIGAAVVGLAVLNEQEMEKAQAAKNNQAVQNKASTSGSNASGASSSGATAARSSCRYQIHWTWTNDTMTMSNIYKIPPLQPGEGPMVLMGAQGAFTSSDRNRVLEKRNDVKLQFDSDGYAYKSADVGDRCN